MITELAEVWCVNDDRPAVVNVIGKNAQGELETRALCADCNWLARTVKLCMVEHPLAGYGPCTKEVGPDGRHIGHHGNARHGWPQ